MKGKLAFAAAFLLMAGFAQAQKNLSLRVFSEVHGKRLTGDFFVPNGNNSFTAMEKQSSLGMQIGAMVGYPIRNKMELCLGIIYSGQGQSYQNYIYKTDDATLKVKRSTHLQYLKIPVVVSAVKDTGKAITFIGFAGMYVAPLVGYTDETNIAVAGTEPLIGSSPILYTSNTTVTATGTNASVKWTHSTSGVRDGETTDEYTLSGEPYKSDMGVMLGAGIQFKISENLFIPVLLNYQLGLADIKNHSALRNSSDSYWTFWTNDGNSAEKNQNSNFGLQFGVKMYLGQKMFWAKKG